MQKKLPFLFICHLLICLCQSLIAQNVSGFVMDQDNAPVPFVNIYVKETETGTSTDDDGKYFINLDPGEYDLVFSSVGYKTKTINVIIRQADLNKNVYLESSSKELDEIVVKANKKDPAYAIIQKAAENRKNFLTQLETYRANVYVKAREDIENSKKKKAVAEEGNIEADLEEEIDPFEKQKLANKKLDAELAKLNLLEMELQLNYQYPNNYKEERTGYKLYGKKDGLFIPNFSEMDFNFYENLISLKNITEVPVVSPIAKTSILTYKFKLEATLIEDGQTVYQIKVIPRKAGNSTVKGTIYINDKIWNINRFDFTFQKGALKVYDELRLKQGYSLLEDSIWLPIRQEMFYGTKVGRFQKFKGNTLILYSDYENNYEFPKKFFGNEVAVTTQEAFDRDSTYWNARRPEPLSIKEQKSVFTRDSIESIRNSKAYQDSVQAEFNKVKLGEILYLGVGFRNNEKKSDIFVGPLLSLVTFDLVGGLRVGPYLGYFKRWKKSGRILRSDVHATLGITNKDPQGRMGIWYRYNPHRLADVYFNASRSFRNINEYDAYLNYFRVSNYILSDRFQLGHRFEVFNGFYLDTDVFYNDRKPIKDYETVKLFDDLFEDNDPLSFERYQALITQVKISYTPGQKFMTEPTRKLVLGSKWPTVSLSYRKGWNNFLTSDIDFDYLEFAMKQNLVLGVFGNTKYQASAGKFINTKDLRFLDIKRFRQSDRWLFSNALNSFQVLDTALVTNDWFAEFHLIHHFNGALINNIPLINKLRIKAVVGGGAIWVKENNFRHGELFAGLERTFKLGPRRRLRIGVYGAFGESNVFKPQSNFKVSFDVIDTWKREWSY